MKIDLHCHSKYSQRPSLWIMQKLGCPESLTEPTRLYEMAIENGFGAVTITDHNVIEGCLDIAHLPNTFISCEYTTYFPDDRCKVHVLAYDITEEQHRDLSEARENIFDLVDYFRRNNIRNVCAHPLFAVNDRLTLSHVEKLILLFKNWEWNGDINPRMNAVVQELLYSLRPDDIEEMIHRHGIVPRFPEPWNKNLTAGSDDHCMLHYGSAYTEVHGARSLDQFWSAVEKGKAQTFARGSTPHQFARKVYGISYQFYRKKFDLGKYSGLSPFLRYLDQTLGGQVESKDARPNWFQILFNRKDKKKNPDHPPVENTLFQFIKEEAERLIAEDPELIRILEKGEGSAAQLDRNLFRFVNTITDRVLVKFGDATLDRFVNHHLLDLFASIGSAGALYALLSPYFLAFSHFTTQRKWSSEVLDHFCGGTEEGLAETKGARVAHFTDTLYEVNGVAKTLRQQSVTARRLGKDYTVVTCCPAQTPAKEGIKHFQPVGDFTLPEYEELRLSCPSFLEMLNYCYDQEFTHFHISTPGPVGLAALGIAKILQIPVSGTYHTSFPQFARALTEDIYAEDLVWKAMVWFYNQLDSVFVPSRATGN
ncbi:MAG: glycosyltransferase, partial [Candidatus Omnitrophica bacterium]|nr:glycosyltransferase [Candidatus Omnitrophota bacterium]